VDVLSSIIYFPLLLRVSPWPVMLEQGRYRTCKIEAVDDDKSARYNHARSNKSLKAGHKKDTEVRGKWK
jgi:hypothetical protein